jgi:hypothetical protein
MADAGDAIPLDRQAIVERLVALILQSGPQMLEQRDGLAQVMDEIETLRQQARQAVAPHVRPTRVACKRCYFRMAPVPPMWRSFCLLGLVRRQCGAIAFPSEATLWDEVKDGVEASQGPKAG